VRTVKCEPEYHMELNYRVLQIRFSLLCLVETPTVYMDPCLTEPGACSLKVGKGRQWHTLFFVLVIELCQPFVVRVRQPTASTLHSTGQFWGGAGRKIGGTHFLET